MSSRRVEDGRTVQLMTGRLCEGEPRFVVDFEDLLDGVHVGGRPQVQTQVVLAGRAHDLLRRQNGLCETIRL